MVAPGLSARARGLGTRLLSADALDGVDAATGWAEACARLGLAPSSRARDVDRAVARRSGLDLEVLARWACGRAPVIDLLVYELDLYDLRVVMRGVAGYVPASRRLADTLPTPTLSSEVLSALAACATVAEMGELLTRLRHPAAEALGRADGSTPNDLLAVEAAMMRSFAEHARRAGGDRAIRAFVDQTLEVHDACAALELAERGAELDPRDYLVGRGARSAAMLAAASETVAAARLSLARAFARTPIAEVLLGGAPHGLRECALRWMIATQADLRRRQPLGAATTLWLVLQRRYEVMRVRRAMWRLSLGGEP